MTKISHHQNRITACLIASIIILLLPALTSQRAAGGQLNQTEWYVPDDFPDIQAAINAVNPGDIIWVRPGIYVGKIDYNNKQIAVRSTDGPEVTTIDGYHLGAVTLGGPGAEISGFTITNGYAAFGAGIKVSGQGTQIKGNIFEYNMHGGGGTGSAIYGLMASPVIDGNIFRNNACDDPVGFNRGIVSFVDSSAPIITNNLFENNSCRAVNISLTVEGAPQVINNTFYSNTVGIRLDRSHGSNNHVYRNNIIVKNGIGLEVDNGTEADNPVWENNLVYGNLINYDFIIDQTGINGNISVDPEFIDGGSGNYHLRTTSPALNSGTSTACPTADFDGVPRPQGASCDIGAYELLYTEAAFTMSDFHVIEGNTAVITVSMGIALPVTATVDFQTSDGSATANTDYLPAAGTLHFFPGGAGQRFTVIILEDDLIEGNETINLTLLNPVSLGAFIEAGGPAVLTIIDDDFASFLPIIVRK